MRGLCTTLLACLVFSCVAQAATHTQYTLVEWSIPGLPEPGPSIACHIDGRTIMARPGETVYTSASAVTPNPAAPAIDIQAAAPARPARQDVAYPKTRVVLPGYPRPQTTAVASDAAYAAITSGDATEHLDEGGIPIPRAFTFDPDRSPVIIPGVSVPDNGRQAGQVTTAAHHRSGDDRRGAEVVEKDPAIDGDNAIMAPPGGGRIYRAEVMLPSSARGIGMGSEYASGR